MTKAKKEKNDPFADLFQSFKPLQIFERFPDLSIGNSGFGGSPVPAQPTQQMATQSSVSPIAPMAPKPPASPTRPNGDHKSAANNTSMPTQAPQSAPRASSLGTQALNTARGEIGVKEQPKGSNRGPRVDQYQDGKGQYWCCHFVSWCVEQNGTSPFGHKGWVEGLRRWAKSKNKYIAAQTGRPLVGDIFTMARHDKTGKVVGGHTGFVESVSEDGRSVGTIEGNTSDKVARRRRSISTLDGYVRI
jgi:hypothetical protein